MKWTVKDNAEDVSVYTRCAEIPEDILNGSKKPEIIPVSFRRRNLNILLSICRLQQDIFV